MSNTALSSILCSILVSAMAVGCASAPAGSEGSSGEETATQQREAPQEPEQPQEAQRATRSDDEDAGATEPEVDYESEEDTSPKAAPVLEAAKLAEVGQQKPEPRAKASLKIVEKTSRPPAEDVADPAPRDIVTSFDLAQATGRNTGGGFTSGVAVDLYAAEVDEVAPRLAKPASEQYELWFREPYRTTLSAYSQRYGGVLRIERFDVDGREVHLVVFARATTMRHKVSIFDEKYTYIAAAFEVGDFEPNPLWVVDLSHAFPPYREIDDIQLGPDGMLYFNVNYPSYAKEVDGETAYFYAVNPEEYEVAWKAGPLVSRGEFLVMDDVILTGYGFTAEPDYLFALDAATGAVLDKERIPSLHDRMRKRDGSVQVVTYDSVLKVRVER